MKPGTQVMLRQRWLARDVRSHRAHDSCELERGPYTVVGVWGDRVDLVRETHEWHGRMVAEFAVLHVPRGMVEVVG